jgi:hypothetical protein
VEKPYAELFLEFLWPSVQTLVALIVPDRACDSLTVELVLDAAGALLTGVSWSVAGHIVRAMLDVLVAREQVLGCFFRLLVSLQKTFGEITDLAEAIFTSFIFPACAAGDPPLAEIMQLVASMRGGWVSIEWVMEGVCEALAGFDSDAIKWSVKAVIRVMRERAASETVEIMNVYGERVVQGVLVALTDGFHNDEFDSLVKLLRKLCVFIGNGGRFNDAWRDLLIAQLHTVVQYEPQDGIFASFVGCLNNATQNILVDPHGDEFREAFVNLLVILKKLSPGDDAVFTAKRQARRPMFLGVW